MAGRALPLTRSRTSLDQERENFEKTQSLALGKAINDIEVPLKAKHARSAIIGTFQEKGSHTFWAIIYRMPIHANPIIAWKFCHCLHKLLREGHPNVLKDSQRHREFLAENGKLWGTLREGYGKLIYLYSRLLVVKLDFHRRNPRFPGNLMIKDEELEVVCENDVNLYFQLSVELLDYMDEILNLQAAIFGSLDMSRSNSMTNAGQCRLSPLIPCIQDSSQVYDFIVKLLFKLHNCLPPDTLEGHRIRFLTQYKALKQFYNSSRNLQYFKTLIQVPILDESPPNFLISSELSRHVTPVVILPPEPAPAQVDATLVQLDSDPSDRNGSSSPDLLAERDRYIEHLLHQIEQLSAELKRAQSEYYRQIGELKQQLMELETRLSEKEAEVEEALKAKEEIERKLSEAAQSAQLGSVVQLQLQETEKKAKGWEEKFLKLKNEVYLKLRDEHITLLRQKAETDKKLSVASAALEQSNKIHGELQESVELSKASLEKAESELSRLKEAQAEQLDAAAENEKLRTFNEQLVASVAKLEGELEEINSKLGALELEKNAVSTQLQESENNVKQSTSVREVLQAELEVLKSNVQSTGEELATFKLAHEVEVQQLTKEREDITEERNRFQGQLDELQREMQMMATQLATIRREKEELTEHLEGLKELQESSIKSQQDLHKALKEAEVSVDSKTKEFVAFKTAKEATILQLTTEQNELKAANEKLQVTVDYFQKEKEEMVTQLATLQQEKQELSSQLSNSKDTLEKSIKVQEDLSEVLKQAEDKANKLAEELQKFKGDSGSAIRNLTTEKEGLKILNGQLQESLDKLEQRIKLVDAERVSLQLEKSNLVHEMEAKVIQHHSVLTANKQETMNMLRQLLVDCAVKAERYLDTCIVDLSKPPVMTIIVHDQSEISTKGALTMLESLKESLYAFSLNESEATLCKLIPLTFPFAQSIGYSLLHGQQLAHSLPDIEKADQLIGKCVSAGKASVLLCQLLQNPFGKNDIEVKCIQVKSVLVELDQLVGALIEKMKASAEKDNVGEELENELGAMERAIEDAAARIAKLWDNSKRSQTGVKLEVNEKVLDSCTALMKAIIELIRKAKALQEEIVARGKGSASAKEFYKRNHRWTEGLLSAAKAVGFGAKLLTDAADKVVQGQAKFEQLTVASQEIAASTAQLVFASRVKAELQSRNLQALADASKAVSLATGGVVATAKHCAELVEDSTVLDFSSLTLHQAKRLEMESQVKVLEFESSLEKERLRLAALRRKHYQLAGENDA